MKRVRRLRNGKRGTVKMWAKYGIAFITDAILRIYSLISEKLAPYLFRPYSAPEKRNRIVSSAFTVRMIERRESF